MVKIWSKRPLQSIPSTIGWGLLPIPLYIVGEYLAAKCYQQCHYFDKRSFLFRKDDPKVDRELLKY